MQHASETSPWAGWPTHGQQPPFCENPRSSSYLGNKKTPPAQLRELLSPASKITSGSKSLRAQNHFGLKITSGSKSLRARTPQDAQVTKTQKLALRPFKHAQADLSLWSVLLMVVGNPQRGRQVQSMYARTPTAYFPTTPGVPC